MSPTESEYKDLLQKAERLDAILSTAGDAIISADDCGIIHHFNPAAEAMFGYSAEEMIGRNLNCLMPEPHSSNHDDYIRHYEDTGEARVIGIGRELEALRRDGTPFPIELNVTDTGLTEPRLFIGIVRDVSERKQREEERLHFYANYDTLTGLPTREHTLELLGNTLEQCEIHREHAAVLTIRLRQFRQIAPGYGHSVADQVLRQVANRLREHFTDHPTLIGKLAGSRFIVAVSCSDADESHIPNLVNELLNVLSRSYRVDEHDLRIYPQIGVAIFPDDGEQVSTLVPQAEAALGRIEGTQHIPLAFANEAADYNLRQQLAMEADLHHALARDEFFMVYQPKYSLNTGTMMGVEALLRWRHPEHGVVSPADFIPLLESSGLILEVGEWILNESFRQAREWLDAGLPPILMAVNISSLQLEKGNLVRQVLTAMEGSELAAEQIELEITESLLINNLGRTRRQLQTLQGMGIRLALDDFGTGYSALSYLHSFPLHTLKVDRSFITAIGQSRRSEALLRSIIELGRSLRMEVVAEGIEERDQLDFLKRAQCGIAQGFGLARPLPPEEVAALLDAGGRIPL